MEFCEFEKVRHLICFVRDGIDQVMNCDVEFVDAVVQQGPQMQETAADRFTGGSRSAHHESAAAAP